MAIDGLVHGLNDRPMESAPYLLVALNFSRGEPESGEQIYIVTDAHERGVLGRDHIGQLKAYDARQIPTGYGRLSGNGTDVEAFSPGRSVISRLDGSQGIIVVVQLLGQGAQDDLSASLIAMPLIVPVNSQSSQRSGKYTYQCGDSFYDDVA